MGLTLSTSAPSLPLCSSGPFYIIVTARILSTPHPDKFTTLQAYPSPLEALSNRSFHNITCTTKPAKKIEIYPRGWPQYHWDSEDLRSAWSFVSIPPKEQGSYSVRHEVPRNKIEAADLQKRERYRVALTDKCLGARWWTFASLEELEGVRLRAWREPADEAVETETDPKLQEERERERSEKYGDGPASIGENPSMLAMVIESEEVEFEVV